MSDAEMGTKVSLSYTPDWTRDSLFSDVDTSLAKFFERPIIARTYTWTPGQVGAFTASFNPWSDFFGNKRVVNRINNYSMLRAKLHVRFMINGNGFYYGRLMADYWSLPSADLATSAATIIPENAIQASQRMKVFIDPSTCCSNEIELPFVFYKDAVSIAQSEWSQLGTIYVRELQGLKHANASTQPLTITAMVWATDVQMSIPTSVNSASLINQAGDEYSSPGPVEGTATAIAKMAAAVSEVPIIGKYARATEMAARAASKAASIMGWSRPCEIAPAQDMRPKYISDLAPSNAGDNVAKLSVDIKQEVTVDPNVIGADLPDEMSICGIAARESYLTPFPWTTARIAGNHLWSARVTPFIGVTSGSLRYLPACAFAVYPFDYWRCKMRYRFQIVASAYHKGRLLIVWDPVYVQSLETNIQFSRIIDISEERDVTIEVEWGQSQHFLDVPGIASLSPFSTTAFATSDATTNGVLGVYVLNDLATPNSAVNNDIAINVYVSAVDLQVAQPTSLANLTNSYAATVQAGDMDASDNSGNEPGCGPAKAQHVMGEDADNLRDMLVYFGERIVSFRQLLKRYNFHSSFVIANVSTTEHAIWAPAFTDVAAPYGYNNITLHTTTAAGKFNYTSQTMLSYLMPAFVAMRGAHRSKYVVASQTQGAAGTLNVTRNTSGGTSLPVVPVALPITSQSNYARTSRAMKRDALEGSAMTIVPSAPVLEVEFPYYKPVRFDQSRTMIQNANPGVTSPYYNTHVLELSLAPGTSPVTVSRYVAVGEDFSLFWFQGCPPMQVLAPPA